MTHPRKKFRIVLVAVGTLLLAGAGALLLLWWYLQPAEYDVPQVSGIAPPASLSEHCRDAIGEARIETVAEGVHVAVGYDLANTIVVVTEAGNVVIDAGMVPARAARVRADMAAHAPGPTVAIIYTHSHIDHVGGASAWADDDTEIWATDEFADHFVKQYSMFREIETRRAARQFGSHVAEDTLPCSALGRRAAVEESMATGARMPTHTFSERHELRVGGVTLELVEAPGETHDQLFVHLPDRAVIMPGDNYYRAFPNLYTIRGTAPRPVDRWIESIDAMRRRQPVALVPSHTAPLRGANEVAGALTRYRDGIQWVRDRVVRAANRGDDIDSIAEAVGLPEHLASDPALSPLYGQLDWSARAIYANHLGWFDGRAGELYPMAAAERARTVVDRMGGAAAVWADIADTGDPRWALWLLEQLRAAQLAELAPGGRWAVAKAGALERLAGDVGNSNGRAYLLESAHELRNGAAPTPRPRPTDELLDAVPIASFFRVMATRLIPERSIHTHEAVAFEFTDTGERFTVTVRRGVAEISAGDPLPGTPEPIATVVTTTGTWRRLAIDAVSPAAAVASGDLEVRGRRLAFYTFSKRFRRGL